MNIYRIFSFSSLITLDEYAARQHRQLSYYYYWKGNSHHYFPHLYGELSHHCYWKGNSCSICKKLFLTGDFLYSFFPFEGRARALHVYEGPNVPDLPLVLILIHFVDYSKGDSAYVSGKGVYTSYL